MEVEVGVSGGWDERVLTAHDFLDVVEDEVHELVVAFEGAGYCGCM